MAVIHTRAIAAHLDALRSALGGSYADALHRIRCTPYTSDDERVLWVIAVDTPDLLAPERVHSGDVLAAHRAIDDELMRDMGFAWAVTKRGPDGVELRATNLDDVLHAA